VILAHAEEKKYDLIKRIAVSILEKRRKGKGN
jgi:hypothetical protein